MSGALEELIGALQSLGPLPTPICDERDDNGSSGDTGRNDGRRVSPGIRFLVKQLPLRIRERVFRRLALAKVACSSISVMSPP